MLGTRRPGFTIPQLLWWAGGGLVLFVLLIILLRSCGAMGALGPVVVTGVTIGGPATIPGGGSGSYTVTVTVSTAPTAPLTIPVTVVEDDALGAPVTLATTTVTIPARATSGTATVTLSCTVNGVLAGPAGQDGAEGESEYEIEAGATSPGSTSPTWSSEHDVECQGG